MKRTVKTGEPDPDVAEAAKAGYDTHLGMPDIPRLTPDTFSQETTDDAADHQTPDPDLQAG